MMKRPMWNTAVQIAGKGVGVLISLMTTGILTRRLGLDGYGSFILITSLFVFLDSLADFGTKTIGIREVAKEEKEVMGEIFHLRAIMAGAAFLLGLGVVWSWKGLAGVRMEATVALLMVWLTSMAGYFEIVFASRLRMDLKVLGDVCFPLAFLIWICLGKVNISLMAVMAAYLATRVFSILVSWGLVSRIWIVRIGPTEWARVKKLWKMTWPMGVFLILFAAYDRMIDAVMIRSFLGTREVAWYGLAYKIYGVLIQPAYFYVNSIFPMMSSKMAGKKKLFIKSWILLVGGAIIMAGVVYVTAPLMVTILAGETYMPSVAVLRILMLAAVFSYSGHLAGFTLISKGGQGEMLKLGIIGLVTNLTLNFILIPRYGILAAAWVTVITEAVDNGLMMWWLRMRINKKY